MESILEIGWMAGKSVVVDVCTEAMLRGAFARAYVILMLLNC